MSRFVWTDRACQILRDHYQDRSTREVAALVGCSERACYWKAASMGLRKSQEYLNSSRRIQNGFRFSPSTEFKPGHETWNKGMKMPDEVRQKVSPTMFKKGVLSGAARNKYVPVGSLRVTLDGALERKVTDDPNVPSARRWVPVARLVWEASNGPIPRGNCVVFKAGMLTTIEHEITIDRLDCISRGENMRRNSIHAHGPEIARIHQLRGAITRKSNNLLRKNSNEK